MSKLPLNGIKVVEFAGIGPGPMAGMILADFGADVIRIDRPGERTTPDVTSRGKRSVTLSIKSEGGNSALRKLLSTADVVIDPYRPGVLEKYGFGPDDLSKLSDDRIIFARMTGFRRIGPFASMAGHDINYIALSGVLSMIRPKDSKPYPPLNLLGDFAGGGFICAMGIMMALLDRHKTGKGQVVEANMQEGARYVSAFVLLHQMPSTASDYWSNPPGENLLDGGSPWYNIYETSDKLFMSVGAIEPQFYKTFINTLSSALDRNKMQNFAYPKIEDQHNRATWPSLKEFLTTAFKTKTRDEWTQVFLGTDSCVAPVLEPQEIGEQGDESARGAIDPPREDRRVQDKRTVDGGIPGPAPNLSRTPGKIPEPDQPVRVNPGSHNQEILEEIGYDKNQVKKLIQEHERSSKL